MSDVPRLVLVTGLSGSGKSQALRFLEDGGYYCVDNLPAALVPTFAELAFTSDPPRPRVAVCADARSGEDVERLPDSLDAVEKLGVRPDVLFMDCSDEVLQKRYSETRRRHPAAPTGGVEEGIRRERELLAPLRARADVIIDTSELSVAELRDRVAGLFISGDGRPGLTITVLSFGFKFGLPPEADLVMDCRFLPNPHYDPVLRPRTGEEKEVRDYVLENPDGAEFTERLRGLLAFLVPRFVRERKSYLTIAVGCTGGRHRSVAVAGAVADILRDLGYEARLRHRDVARTPTGGA